MLFINKQTKNYKLHEHHLQWLDKIIRKPKLLKYVTFKNSYEVETYALIIHE